MGARVVTDSTNYLPREDLDRFEISVVPLHVHDGDAMRPGAGGAHRAAHRAARRPAIGVAYETLEPLP